MVVFLSSQRSIEYSRIFVHGSRSSAFGWIWIVLPKPHQSVTVPIKYVLFYFTSSLAFCLLESRGGSAWLFLFGDHYLVLLFLWFANVSVFFALPQDAVVICHLKWVCLKWVDVWGSAWLFLFGDHYLVLLFLWFANVSVFRPAAGCGCDLSSKVSLS